MKLIVNPHKIEIDKSPVNEREVDITKCEFEFADEITNDYVKEAYFTFNGTSYKEIIVNNQCAIPSEVLAKKGQVEIGVVAFLVENEEEIKRYNPSPAYFNTWLGSLKDNAENSEPITPSEMEQFEQALNDGLNEVANVDIDAEQLDNGMSVTITNRDGEDKTVYAYDGEQGETGATPNIQIGTVVTGDHSAVTRTGTNENPIFNFVLEKGDKGDTGNGIANVTKTSTSGLVDTYTITYTNGTTTTFDVTNGKGITNIAKTSTSGLEDTYTITYNDNTTSTFTVTNGNGISSIEKTGTQDNVDTYTIYYTNGTTSTFTVTNSTVTNQEFEELKAEHEELVNTLPRVEGTGESITLDNTAQYKMNVALNPSELSQDGTPTPSSPVPINAIKGDNTLTVFGKNLSPQSVATTTSSGNLNTTSGFFGYVEQGKTYTLSLIIDSSNTSTGNTVVRCFTSMSGGTNQGEVTHFSRINGGGQIIKTFTSPYTGYISFNGSGMLNSNAVFYNVQLEHGSIGTDYEEYQSQTYPINLGSLEYCKIGNYSDSFLLTSGKNLFMSEYVYTPSQTKNANLAAGTYTFSMCDGNVFGANIYFKLYDSNDNIVTTNGHLTSNRSLSFSTTSYAYYGAAGWSSITFTIDSGYKLNIGVLGADGTRRAMLVTGDKIVRDYEPYGNGTWYLKKNINKVVLDGSTDENWTYGSTNTTNIKRMVTTILINSIVKPASASTLPAILSDYYTPKTANQTYSLDVGISVTSAGYVDIYDSTYNTTDVDLYKIWLSAHNVTVYYALATPTYTQITDTTLVAQLNNLYTNISSYLGQTNITQTNADLPFVINASALYDLNNLISRVATLEVGV